MNSPLSIIISREYLERVKRKSFIISTLLVPVFMVALMVAPAALMLLSEPETKAVSVIDQTGKIAQRLHGNGEVTFATSGAQLDSLRQNHDVDVIIVAEADAIDRPQTAITVYSRGSLGIATDSYITSQLNRAIEDVRLDAYNMGNIRQILREVEVDCSYPAIRLDREDESASSSAVSYGIAMFLDMLLYMFILIYGQMVMTSIIEEKTNRVLEIVVSSARPFDLMLGKITGVGLVAVTQILIWAVLIGTAAAVATPFLTPETLGADMPDEVAAGISQITDPGFLLSLLLYALLFFIGGFLFYASIFAAIGSAVSNVQDASQLSTIATMPVIIGIIGSMAILNNPSSALAFWISVIPFTSPMAMMARLPYGVPGWEIALSLVLLYLSFVFMIWLCGKIYRVGIFMYGKKPNFKELWKWIRYPF